MCLACLCVSHAAGGIYTIIGVRVVITSINMDLRVCVCVRALGTLCLFAVCLFCGPMWASRDLFWCRAVGLCVRGSGSGGPARSPVASAYTFLRAGACLSMKIDLCVRARNLVCACGRPVACSAGIFTTVDV